MLPFVGARKGVSDGECMLLLSGPPTLQIEKIHRIRQGQELF